MKGGLPKLRASRRPLQLCQLELKKPALMRRGHKHKTEASIPAGSGRRHQRRHRDELGHLAEVMGGSSVDDLILGAICSSQAEAVKLQDAFEVRNEHLNVLMLTTRRQTGVGSGDIARQLAGPSWMNLVSFLAGVLSVQRYRRSQPAQSFRRAR